MSKRVISIRLHVDKCLCDGYWSGILFCRMPPKKRKAQEVSSSRRPVRRKQLPQKLVDAPPRDGMVEEDLEPEAIPLPQQEMVVEPGCAEIGAIAGVQALTDNLVPMTLPMQGNDDATMALAKEIAAVLRARKPLQNMPLHKLQQVATASEAKKSDAMAQQQPVVPEQVPVMSNDKDNIGASLSMLLGAGESQSQATPSVPLINLSSQAPLGASIPLRIKEKIWDNQYVDLGLLIGQNHSSDRMNLSVSMDKNAGQCLSLISNLRPKPIRNIEDWVSAFIVFTALYTERHPYQAPRLMKYIEIVRDIAKKGGLAFKIYDENFRFMKQAQPEMCWDIMHAELWVRASSVSPIKPPFRDGWGGEPIVLSVKDRHSHLLCIPKKGFLCIQA